MTIEPRKSAPLRPAPSRPPKNGQGLVPPMDIEAEGAILGAVLLEDPEKPSRALAELPTLLSMLEPHHFYSTAHQRIWEAYLAVSRSGRTPDIVLVSSWLHDHGHLEIAGGPRALANLVQCAPAIIGNVTSYAELVIDKWRARQLIATAQVIAARGYAETDVRSYVSTAFREVRDIAEASSLDDARVKWLATDAIFAPLAPTDWIVRDLAIAAGRPTMIAGYGFSGKTIAIQSLALSLASGGSVWGQFPAGRKCTVRHLDYEQGHHASRKRYQRLARAMCVTPEQLEGRLALGVFPNLFLTQHDARDEFRRQMSGVDVCIVDALRGAAPDVDENASESRSVLDLLTWVSDKTGTAFIVLHHAGKPRDGHNEDNRTIARGSSALFDACGTVYVMAGRKGHPVKVSNQKTAAEFEGFAVDDFYLAIDDLAIGTDTKAGVIVQYKAEADVQEAAPLRIAALQSKIVRVLRKKPYPLSTNSVVSLVSARKADVMGALDMLRDEGLVECQKRSGRGGGTVWSLNPDADLEEAEDS